MKEKKRKSRLTPKPQGALPPQEDSDLQERMTGFNKDLGILLAKYELGLGAEASLTKDGRVAARPILVDARRQLPPEEPKSPESDAKAAPEAKEEKEKPPTTLSE